MRNKATVAVVVAVVVIAAHAAADESGTFRFIRSFYHSYVTIEHGAESFTGGILRGTLTITDSSGGPFVADVHSSAECLVYSRRSDDAMSLQAPCLNVDTSGDHLYTVSLRDHGTLGEGGGGAGRLELRGGTGKYEGITGSCTYRTRYLEGDRGVSIADCKWRSS